MEDDMLFHRIQDFCDVEEVLDLLNVGTGQLCLKFRKEILQNREKFEGYLEEATPNDDMFGMHIEVYKEYDEGEDDS